MEAHLQIFINEAGPYAGTLEMHVDEIDVSTLGNSYKPDPGWFTVDKAGHYHAFTRDGELPTLRRVGRKFRCSICEKRIRPGYVVDQPGGIKRTMPGRTWWNVQVEVAEPIAQADPVSVRMVQDGEDRLFGIATRSLTSARGGPSGPMFTYGWTGITELGRRP